MVWCILLNFSYIHTYYFWSVSLKISLEKILSFLFKKPLSEYIFKYFIESLDHHSYIYFTSYKWEDTSVEFSFLHWKGIWNYMKCNSIALLLLETTRQRLANPQHQRTLQESINKQIKNRTGKSRTSKERRILKCLCGIDNLLLKTYVHGRREYEKESLTLQEIGDLRFPRGLKKNNNCFIFFCGFVALYCSFVVCHLLSLWS